METISTVKAHGGVQGVYRHRSHSTDCDMTFAVFVPEHAPGEKLPVLWYLSGLTCNHQNAMDKGEYRRAAAEHRLIVVLPDTSPRGPDIPDEADDWKFGSGAGFYVDAVRRPYAENYRMASYVTQELPSYVGVNFPADLNRMGIMGHSMGGHGALTLSLNNPGLYRSCSALAPICNPTEAGWSRPALDRYLGPDPKAQRGADACLLIEDGKRFGEFYVDQGTLDPFLADGLMPERLKAACEKADIPLILHMREGYDHSYSFISTFMADHVAYAADRLTA